MGGALVLQVLEGLAQNGYVKSQPQDNALASYASLLTKEDGRINWSQNAQAIDRQIRALNPWPGVFTGDGAARIKILRAHVTEQISDKPPGTILSRHGDVACGDGTVLRVETLQPAGKQAMDFAGAINGGYARVGQCL